MNQPSEHFDLLRQRYAGSLGEKQRAMTQAWAAFSAAPSDAGARGELQQQLHRLCGSAQAYEYAHLGELACSADSLLRRWEGAPTDLRDAPADLAQRLVAPVRAVIAGLGEARAGAVDHASEARPRVLRVLLIEDDPAQAELIGAELEAHGCKVRCDSGGDLLWQTLTLWPCHAIVLDYWLRGETAADIVASLRRDPRHACIALICYSVERDSQILRTLLDVGCDAVLPKAEGTRRLFDVVRACVAQADRSGPDIRLATA